MSTSNANEPAFPHHAGWEHKGLTKREEFAKAAMQGLLARGCQVDDTLAKESRIAAELLLAELAGQEGTR